MEYVLLTWIGTNLFFVDIYKNIEECHKKAEYIFRNEVQYEYICSPNDVKTHNKIVKGVFHEGLLKSNEKK